MALELVPEQGLVLVLVLVPVLPQVQLPHLPVLALAAPELAPKPVHMLALVPDQDLEEVKEGEVAVAVAEAVVVAVAVAQAMVMVRAMAMVRVTVKAVVIKELCWKICNIVYSNERKWSSVL